MRPPQHDPQRARAGSAAARRVLASLAALLVGTLISILLLEAVVLLCVGEQPRFPRRVVGASFGVRINEPGATYWHRSADVDVEFRINRRGMRSDRDYPYAKPPDVLRVVSLGDSFTVGYEVDVEQTFSSVLERDLRESGLRVEVLNAGVSGYSTAEQCLYLERELLRYDPDLVLVSFFGNDLVDNVRSGLFRLEGDRLVEAAAGYVPGGGVGDWLNTNPLLGWLSERSNAFALLKERLTLLVKRRIVDANRGNLGVAGAGDGSERELQRRLAAAIFERIYASTLARGVPLLIQSIPMQGVVGSQQALLDLFPLEEFDVGRKGIAFFPARSVLEPQLGRTPLYHSRSHGHWTPEAHELAGQALARVVVEMRLLD